MSPFPNSMFHVLITPVVPLEVKCVSLSSKGYKNDGCDDNNRSAFTGLF